MNGRRDWVRIVFVAGCVLAIPFVLRSISPPSTLRGTVRNRVVTREPASLLMEDAPLEDIVAAIEQSGQDVQEVVWWYRSVAPRPLFELAVEKGRLDVAQWLVDNGADPHVRPELVTVAMLNKDAAMARFLLQNWPDPRPAELSNLLGVAVLEENPAMVALLVAYGADPEVPCLLGTPRELAEKGGNENVLAAIDGEAFAAGDAQESAEPPAREIGLTRAGHRRRDGETASEGPAARMSLGEVRQ